MKTIKTMNKTANATTATKPADKKVCAKKSAKKPCKKNCKKSFKKSGVVTRADKRQINLTERYLDEKRHVDEVVNSLESRLYDLDARDKTPIDRDLMAVRYAILKAYSEILFATAHFEHVRVRRSDGDFLNRDIDCLMNYLFGESAVTEMRLLAKNSKLPAKKACNESVKKAVKASKDIKAKKA